MPASPRFILMVIVNIDNVPIVIIRGYVSRLAIMRKVHESVRGTIGGHINEGRGGSVHAMAREVRTG